MSVQYIGSNMDADNSKQFDITVERLATPQVNRGVYLARAQVTLCQAITA